MAFLTEPAHVPAQLRDNAYSRPCTYCGGIVPAGEGVAFLLWSDHLNKNKWESCHGSVVNGCFADFAQNDYKPMEREAQSGSIAARAVAERKEEAATLEAIMAAPALTMPDAPKMQELMAAALAEAVDGIAVQMAGVFNAVVPELVQDGIRELRPLSIMVADRPAITVERSHKALPDVLLMVANGTSPFLVGPAGSGKTTLAEQVATCLNRPFYMASRVTSEYKLVGFVDANGKTVRTQFREAYEHGGVFLFDEVDASDPRCAHRIQCRVGRQAGRLPRRHGGAASGLLRDRSWQHVRARS